MFAGNNKVSIRQLNRIIVTENIGMTCLLGGYMAGRLGSLSYIWLFAAAMLISMGYMWISLRISAKYGDKLVRSKVFNVITAIRFLAMACVGICIFYKAASALLLRQTAGLVIIAAIAVLAIFVAKHNYEARGRMHELLYYFVLIPVAVILITSSFKIDTGYAWEQLSQGFKLPDAGLLPLICLMFLMTSYFEKLIVIRGSYYNTRGSRLSLLRGPLILWLAAAWVYAVCCVIFGEHATLLKLMDIGGIPGGFLGRQESVMAVFLVVSLTSYVSGMFYYLRQNVKNVLVRYAKRPHRAARRITSAALPAVAVLGAILLTLRMEGGSAAGDGIAEADGKISWSSLTDGDIIGGREIEQWDFVMSLLICGGSDEKVIIAEIIDCETKESRYTAYREPKNNGEDMAEDDGCAIIDRMAEKYVSSGRNYPDFSHIKGILFAADMPEKAIKKIVDGFSDDIRFSGNIPVFALDLKTAGISDGEGYDGIAEKYPHMGEKLENLAENVEEYGKSRLYRVQIDYGYLKEISLGE